MSEFDKVDRALEAHVIDWLQFGEFEENLLKNPDGSDMAALTLKLISKRKAAYTALEQQLAETQAEHALLGHMVGSEQAKDKIKVLEEKLKKQIALKMESIGLYGQTLVEREKLRIIILTQDRLKGYPTGIEWAEIVEKFKEGLD